LCGNAAISCNAPLTDMTVLLPCHHRSHALNRAVADTAQLGGF